MAYALTAVKLDLDRKWTRCAWAKWCERAAAALDIIGLTVEEVEVRETVKGFHVIIYVRENLYAPESRAILLAVQAILGSDSLREALNLRRALDGRVDDWNVLFVQKGDGPAVKPRLDYAGVLVDALRAHGQPSSVVVRWTPR